MLLRVLPGLLLVTAAVSKLADPTAFQLAILDFQLVGFQTAALIAATLPWFELLTGLALVSGRLVAGALLVGSLLYGGFSFLLASTLIKGSGIECGCLGLFALPTPAMLAIDVTMLGFLILFALLEPSQARGPAPARLDG